MRNISYKLGFGILAGTDTYWSKLSSFEGGWDVYKFIDDDRHSTDDITTVVRGTLGTTILIHKQFGFNMLTILWRKKTIS